jgi:assimilatory nitrate reductase catalytic subunit
VIARARADGTAEIAGDPDHPANFGRLCSKGSALGETLSLDGRLLHPVVDGRRTTWDEALGVVAHRFSRAVAEHGPDSVAFYVSGQILTEDYYVANKLMKGFIGSANIDTNSRLCMASSVAGHKRAFGTDTVPGCYEDLERADLVVLVGSNLAWCHPVLYQRLAAARETRGTRVVVIDPRETATCEIADLHLALRPGSDVALFNGLLAHLAATGRIDRRYVDLYTSGMPAALAAASAMPLAEVVDVTGLSPSAIADFYELFAGTERAVTVYSQGVNQSSAGTDKVNSILNCHLVTGRIGREGMGPFSVTGQPNAMGGRETGGLANMLAAHMELADPAHRSIVQDFWASPSLASAPGLKAVDLFRAVGEGRIKALWIMATNPVVSMPDADAVRRALEICPFVAVSDVVAETDTTRHAHVVLPSTAWGEKDGTVTNSERRISRQRAFLPAPGEARPDWWQLTEVARRMGFASAFAWQNPSEIFAEYARLTAARNDGSRDLDIGAHAGIDAAAYAALAPFQWPQPTDAAPSETRFFSEGGFFTADKRARLIPTPFRAPVQQASPRFPLVLNTGRIRDQWHTMTRTSKSPRLMAQVPEPVVEMAASDAAALGFADGVIAEIESANGRALARVVVTVGQPPGSIFVPMHWTSQQANRSRIDAVVGAATDPVSGQPEMKHTGVAIRAFPATWHAFAVSYNRPATDVGGYIAIAAIAGGWRAELAGIEPPADWEAAARCLVGAERVDADLLAYRDVTAGQHRFAAFLDGRLVGALFVAPRPLVMARTWAADLLGQPIPPEARLRLLAGRPGGGQRDKGPIVCACLEVGRNEIVGAIVEQGAASVAAVGAITKAGTNCGSCRSDIRRILDEARLEKAG